MRYLCFLFLLACNAPTAEFASAPVQTIKVGQSTFDVRINGPHAQAIRTNSEWAPTRNYTLRRFITAIEAVSDCKIVPKSLTGDAAMMEALLDCPGKPTPELPKPRAEFYCWPERLYPHRTDASQYGFICEER